MQQVFFGVNSIINLPDILKKISKKKVFLVTGKKSFEYCGAEEVVMPLLKEYEITIFNNFTTNPSLENVQKGVNLFKASGSTLIIAIGGGSVIDMGKLIALFSSQSDDTYNIDGKFDPVVCDLVAIPTTAGSGSEATHFAVLYINGKKYSCADKTLLPKYAIVDPQFIFSSPPDLIAECGTDAFCQAIESWWSVNSNEESLGYSQNSLELIVNNLKDAFKGSRESLIRLSEGSHIAGKAINISKTTLPHALSYPITSHFNLAHGRAVALFLPSIFNFNEGVSEIDCNDKRGSAYVLSQIKKIKETIGIESENNSKSFLESFFESIQIKTNLRSYEINILEAKNAIVSEYSEERALNNPRLAKIAHIKHLIEEIS